ncbi:MAG TPA: peptidase inhibitor family I36 protein [Actinoplanes sp.]
MSRVVLRRWTVALVATGITLVVGAFGAGGEAAAATGAAGGVLASYRGGQIDLSRGWSGAQACAEFAPGDVRCYDSTAQADQATGELRPMALYDCPNGWVCLWQSINFKGRRLQWSSSGTKKLAQWGFRDQASSAALMRPQGGAECTDYRSGLPDPHLFLRADASYSDFRNISYVYGGNWNDRVDQISM